ncbi:MAG TPA: DUF362 domain-containing protein, partial [Candidatus Ozemobacteraceae bacterium]|nr:DUF362 domain-containing protein [Candidatus Ozemobacteraceae bacterium]
VDLLMIQKKIHRGVFAVMDGTFAGDGPGPRCMIPHVKNVILASADQVAIDAVAAKLMGFDPLRDIKFIRLAHEKGLGCGDPSQIEIVGDLEAARMNWQFQGPFKEMTFAARQQHAIYWGPLKKPIEWSLKTWLAPWSYVASVFYHDWLWYPLFGKLPLKKAMRSNWGRLFEHWSASQLNATGTGYSLPTTAEPGKTRITASHYLEAARLLLMAIRESPEWQTRQRRQERESQRSR